MRHPFDGIVTPVSTEAREQTTRRGALERMFAAAAGVVGLNAAARAQQLTTEAVGEEGGKAPPIATTLAVGEEGGARPITQALKEQGGATTNALNEEGGIRPPVAPNSRDLTPEQLKAAWADLAATDASKANQAVASLVAGKQTVPFLKDNLKPAVVQVDNQRVAALIKDLDSDGFMTREKATTELVKIGAGVLPLLNKELQNMRSAEQRMRAERVIQKVNELPAVLQAQRGLDVLVFIGSADAKGLLEKLSKESADAWLTALAKGAVERMSRPVGIIAPPPIPKVVPVPAPIQDR